MAKSNLADSFVKEKVALITIGDVFDEVYRLADENLEIEAELADILKKILGVEIIPLDAGNVRDLLNLERQNYDDTWLETKISQLGDEKFESKSLNRQELQELLDKQEEALANGEAKETIAEELAEKYGAKKSQVDEWLARLEKYQKDLESQGLSKGIARDVAEMAVVKEKEVTERLVKVGVEPVKAIENSKRMVESAVVLEKIDNKSEAVKKILSEVKVDKLVAKKMDAEAKVFISDLKDNIAASDKKFDGFDQVNETRVHEQAKVAIKEIWQGKITDIDEAWVPVDGKQIPFVELVSGEIGGDQTSVLIVSNAISQRIRQEINQNKQTQVSYQFLSIKEEVKNEAIKINPGIEGSDVLDRYAEFAASMTMPVIETGIGEELVEKGSASDVVAKTNLMVGMMIHRAGVAETIDNIETFNKEIGGEIMASSPSGRALMEFGSAYRNPEFGQWINSVSSLFKPSQLLGNKFVVEGLTNVAVRFAGPEVLGGIATADLVGVTLEQVASGKSMLDIGLAVKNAGGIANWVAAGKVAASGATAVAAEGGKLALKETGKQLAAKVAGLLGLQAIPGLGQAITIGLAVIAGVKLAVKGIEGLFAKFGIDLKKLSIGAKVKKFFREDLNLGKFGDWMAIPVTIGGFLLTIPFLALSSAFAALQAMIAPILISIIVGLFVYQTLVPNQLASSLAPTSKMIGTGEEYYGGSSYDPNGPPLIAPDLIGAECSLAGKTAGIIKQCDPQWNGTGATLGSTKCTMCQAGCGIASLSAITMRVNNSLNPNYWTRSEVYKKATCRGSNLDQAMAALLAQNQFTSGDVIKDGACSPTSIARAMCDGNKLVILAADYYYKNATAVMGHIALAVGVRNGEIVVMDPYFNEAGNSDGYTTPFLRSGEPAHDGAIYRMQSCLVVNADKIN